MATVTDKIIDFTMNTQFENLPTEIIHEAKRSLLDSIGSLFTGYATEKGKIALNLANRFGGAEESSVIGSVLKIPCTTAAMANSELMYALDFDSVPHIPPFIIPPVLAMAECNHRSGKDVLVAIVIGQELAKRIDNSMNSIIQSVSGSGGKPKTPDVFGNSNEHMLGAGLAVGRLMGLDRERLENALGLAGYLCSLPVGRDWEDTMPKSIVKYSPAGWNCQAAVTACLLAEQGYTGSRTMLDNPYGFHVFYGAAVWNPALITDGLGESWEFPDCQYKLYPCCRFLQSAIDCLMDLVAEHKFIPDEIAWIKAYSLPFLAHPDQLSVTTQIDAQYSFPYAAAMAVHNIKCGVDWQNPNIIRDPEIQSFMKKVSIVGDPKAGEEKKKDPKSWYARVEMEVEGIIYSKETYYSKGTNIDKYRLSDDELIAKFRHNASPILTERKIENAIKQIMELENLDDIADLMKFLTI
ncbi:MmgE/PrpD family protein [Sphaerochaeta sp.]|jgi:2-methylcitrate dehydratase PrpD|uniref:MmgE/PrpD family protein n=1 Tax=Sphaerochaeta sp. TaxID=1972642 RepID=UPI002A36DF4B|nr:MmgE/PrpD family protein [Sphaerochaeta sp.]MDX9982697.1 MmgE/PrpD family protein [Sphaerochaeta sp.]